ncbi:MAG: stage III sporulation protein AF, partial [Bacillota bacterium]
MAELVETLKQWVAELAVMGLVLAFAEMLLPRNDLRRFARVVVGLVMVAVILTSLVDISRLENAIATPSLSGVVETEGRGRAGYAKIGERIAEAGLQVAGADVKERISRQIESLARLSSGVDHVSAHVLVGPSGKVERILVVLRATGAGGSRAGPQGVGDPQGPQGAET